jgi:hypothetical protein
MNLLKIDDEVSCDRRCTSALAYNTRSTRAPEDTVEQHMGDHVVMHQVAQVVVENDETSLPRKSK